MTDSELPFAYNNWNLTLQSTEVWNKTEYNRTALDHAPGKFQTSSNTNGVVQYIIQT